MSHSAKRNTEVNEAAMRAKGLVPKTIWVYDVDAPGFKAAMAAEGRRLAEADAKDPTIESFLEAAWIEMDEETRRSEK